MSEQPSLEFHAKFALAIAGILVFPAIWSFFSAIWSAATTGQVLVISVGRYETARSLVDWRSGWARFAGPVLLVGSLFLWGASGEKKSRAWWWLAAALSTIGIALLLFSRWFTTVHGFSWFMGMLAFTATTLYVGNRFGRVAAILIVLLAFGFIAWRAMEMPPNAATGRAAPDMLTKDCSPCLST